MAKPERDTGLEAVGWLSIAVIMVLFPSLFFLFVYIPIWLGATPRW